MPQAFFTAQDVASVKGESPLAARAEIASRLGYHFHQLSRTSNAFKLAAEIAFLLQKDSHEAVRQALAQSVAAESKAPVQLITALATDTCAEVAVPVLEASPKLTDAVLLPLIRATREVERLLAITRRGQLSSPACLELIQKRIEAVCVALIERHAAALDAQCQASIATHYAENRVVMQHLRGARMLPSVGEAPIAAAANDSATNAMTDGITNHAEDAGPSLRRALDASMLRWRRAFAETHAAQASMPQAEQSIVWMRLIEQMNREGALHASSMLLALGMGILPLFALCMARQSRLKTEEAMAACKGSEQDFRMLYLHSHLPAAFQKLCWWGLSAAREQLAKGEQPCSDAMMKAMARKFAQAEKMKINMAQTLARPVVQVLLEPV